MKRPRFLNKDEFAQVIRNASLVAIDLIVRDPDRCVLVGFRTNEPAKGKWFVPGGVVRKYERLADAFARIVKTRDHDRLTPSRTRPASTKGQRGIAVFKDCIGDHLSDIPAAEWFNHE